MSRLDKLMNMLEAEPRDTFVLYAIAQEKGKAGDWAGAAEFYQRCLDVDPDYCYAWFHKASAERENGDSAAAAKTLEKGIETARRVGDEKAAAEMSVLLEEIRP